MNKIRKFTQQMLDVCLFGSVVAFFILVATALLFSGYTGYYLMDNFDRLADDMVRRIAKIEAVGDRLDSHAQFLIRKTNQIQKASGGERPGGQKKP